MCGCYRETADAGDGECDGACVRGGVKDQQGGDRVIPKMFSISNQSRQGTDFWGPKRSKTKTISF